MDLLGMIDDLETSLVAARIEAEKFQINGNKAAGTRVRKIMQIVKEKAQNIRNGVLEIKKGDK